MSSTNQFAKHFRELHFGKSWTGPCLKDMVSGLSWKQAVEQYASCNSIAALVFHVNYYVRAANNVFRGNPLDASDKYSFDMEPIRSQEDWDALLNSVWDDAREFAEFVEALPDDSLDNDFDDGKYGTTFRNVLGVIEHTQYHLGQIAILKKLITD